MLPAGGWVDRVGGQHCTAGQYGYVPLGHHLAITQPENRHSNKKGTLEPLWVGAAVGVYCTSARLS